MARICLTGICNDGRRIDLRVKRAEAIRTGHTAPGVSSELNEGWYQVRIAGRDAAKMNYLPVLMSRWQMVP